MNNTQFDNFDDDLPFSPYSEDEEKTEEIETIFLDDEKNKTKSENNDRYNKIFRKIKFLPIFAFIFVFILGIYIFVNNVNADVVNLIKIQQQSKVGYIDNDGKVIVKAKYLYGSDYYNGYAVVRNYNNLYGILNGKGENEIAFGNIFSATLYDDIYIVSKFTNEGLKMGLLDENLKEVTRFKYDNLSYSKSGIFIFTREDTMGLMNKNGKEIYTYKVDEIDDKNISIEVSNKSDSSKEEYAKVKINDSSTIININTGKEVYKYTLDDINVLDNNVFYIKNKNTDDVNNYYFVIDNDKVIYETNMCKRLKIEDSESLIATCIKDSSQVDYINLLTRDIINSNNNIKYTYSDSVILTESYNFTTNKNEFTIYTPSKILGNFENLKPVNNKYINGFMQIKTDNNKYNYINKNGDILCKKEYDNLYDFNVNGFSIVENNSEKGIINNKCKEIVSTKYDEIIMLDDDLFKTVKKYNNKELFIFKQNDKYGIIDSDDSIIMKPIYDDFTIITSKYPMLIAKYGDKNLLINLQSLKELNIEVSENVQIYSNYIVSNSNYYNYNGELIYSVGDN